MLLTINDLVVHYRKVAAVKGISLVIEEKDIVTIIGSNGAGKSTIMRAISGLKSPTSGTIQLRAERIDGLPAPEIVKRGVSQVPEGRGVFPFLSVLSNLQMGAFLIKEKSLIKNEIEEVFLFFPRLKERIRQRAGTLSGGEQQMLAIGRALMTNPALLLLDEPSLGLAPLMVEHIGEIIEKINRQKAVSIILVEQNAQMALSLANKVYVLETGRIVLEGDPSTLLGNEHVVKAYLGG